MFCVRLASSTTRSGHTAFMISSFVTTLPAFSVRTSSVSTAFRVSFTGAPRRNSTFAVASSVNSPKLYSLFSINRFCGPLRIFLENSYAAPIVIDAGLWQLG